jgi:hypothetical protein
MWLVQHLIDPLDPRPSPPSPMAIGRAVRTEGAGRRYAALAERRRRGERWGSGQPPA